MPVVIVLDAHLVMISKYGSCKADRRLAYVNDAQETELNTRSDYLLSRQAKACPWACHFEQHPSLKRHSLLWNDTS